MEKFLLSLGTLMIAFGIVKLIIFFVKRGNKKHGE